MSEIQVSTGCKGVRCGVLGRMGGENVRGGMVQYAAEVEHSKNSKRSDLRKQKSDKEYIEVQQD